MTWERPPTLRFPRARRVTPYRWLRLYVGCADHPKWRRVAKEADVELSVVIATVMKLLETANTGDPRGSVVSFSPEEWALSLGVGREIVDRIWRALEAIGWIDGEHLTKFDVWQPDKEDPTHRERQARYRERKRVERHGAVLQSRPFPGDTVTSVTETVVTPSLKERLQPEPHQTVANDTVTGVTATPRQIRIRKDLSMKARLARTSWRTIGLWQDR